MFGIEKVLVENNFAVYLSGYLKEKYGIVFCFTDRNGGFSGDKFESLNAGYHTGDSSMNVKKNRTKILKKLGFNETGKLYSVKQVHGSRILNIGKDFNLNRDDIRKEADCLLTGLRYVPIMVMGADCNLILITDIKKKIVAAVHAGWKGTLQKIAAKVIFYMKDKFGSRNKDIIAAFGPSIRKCCYRVDSSMIKKFTDRFSFNNFYELRDNSFYLDLVKVNRMQLEEAGIGKNNIYDCMECTFCNHNFYSYRRSGITGRQAAVAVIL
ncbi:MAG: peptidoglycan editing factor PgeF [Actinomycetota bacterium]|nr:peptidoglycan editing factor PgeF [Actinomycetota bacterium]